MVTTMHREPHLRELGEFLKVHRDQLTPDAVGLESTGDRRRVTGLRREEVAQLINISSDYYTRIEQGRLAPSAPVLGSLIEAMRLDEDQAEYVRELADHAARQPVVTPSDRRSPRTPRSAVRPQMRRVLEQLTDTPAIVLGPRTDLLAWNELARRVYVDFEAIPPAERNYVRLIFTHPPMRELFDDWPSVAKSCVAVLRREAAANPADPALSALVGELSIVDRQFGQWWSARNVARQDFGTKVLNHPTAGQLTLDWDIFLYSGSPEQQLVLNSAEEGSPTQARLRELLAATD